MARIVVLGSLNMDLIARVTHHPSPGETVLASAFEALPGGKGANQAVAAAKLGGDVAMIGRVGADAFGERLLDSLRDAGVDTTRVRLSKKSTGVAWIAVDARGENSIIVASGANADFVAGEIDEDAFDGCQVALFQLETPLATVEAGLRAAKRAGAVTILDPAPVVALNEEPLALVDILTPNESEAAALGAKAALAKSTIFKLGARGCEFEGRVYPGFPVNALDTTAAGDTFNGALAVALAHGTLMPEALRFANAAAAITVTRRGAQPSMPSRREVMELLG
ncbi:MAG: ribokinase [Bryobacteraceae bacterium]|nr:ribokinase [Bryobacteraceae bacterium]